MMPWFFILSESIKFVRKGNRLYALSPKPTTNNANHPEIPMHRCLSIFMIQRKDFQYSYLFLHFIKNAWVYYNIIKTETMGDGKGKKDVNSKRTTHFKTKYTKIQNRPVHNTTNWIFRKIKRPRCKANDTYKLIFFTIKL